MKEAVVFVGHVSSRHMFFGEKKTVPWDGFGGIAHQATKKLSLLVSLLKLSWWSNLSDIM